MEMILGRESTSFLILMWISSITNRCYGYVVNREGKGIRCRVTGCGKTSGLPPKGHVPVTLKINK